MTKPARPPFPFLSLTGLTIDEGLARRLPRRVAYYHVALPLAQDGTAITVVMAQINNPYVIGMLSALLNAEIVPVRGDAAEIRAVLDRVYPPDDSVSGTRILSSGAPDLTALAGTLLGGTITALDGATTPQESVISLANTGEYELTVMGMPPVPLIEPLLRGISTPLWLSRSIPGAPPIAPMRRILGLVRGGPPDNIMLDWALRLARAGEAAVTLLAVARSEHFPVRGIGRLVPSTADSTAQGSAPEQSSAHIARLTTHIADQRVPGALKLRQGDPITQIVRETTEHNYDVIVTAAEAYGSFIQRMIAALDSAHSRAAAPCSLLVVRPA
ncbi:MAG: universal stress protein [Anaerolineae bacterium]